MGKITDEINKLKENADLENKDKSELIEACVNGFVYYKRAQVNNSHVYYIYLKYKNMSTKIGYFEPKRTDAPFMIGDKVYIDDNLVDCLNLSVCNNIYISLDELIKHGAKEIKVARAKDI